MNGVSSTLKEEIKKSHNSKKKEKFKFIAIILLTNIMVAILCMPAREEKAILTKNIKTLHTNYQMMLVPMQALVSSGYEQDRETPVSLLSRDKKLISVKAYLHEEIKSSGELSQFKIEISNSDVFKVSQATDSGVIAVPYVESKKINMNKRGSKYEVSL